MSEENTPVEGEGQSPEQVPAQQAAPAPPPAPAEQAPDMSGRPGPASDTSKVLAGIGYIFWPVALVTMPTAWGNRGIGFFLSGSKSPSRRSFS